MQFLEKPCKLLKLRKDIKQRDNKLDKEEHQKMKKLYLVSEPNYDTKNFVCYKNERISNTHE